MSRIKVHQTVEIYEINDEDVPLGQEKSIGVDSHWNQRERITLVIGKKHYAVLGNDLKTAIDNAMNSGGI